MRSDEYCCPDVFVALVLLERERERISVYSRAEWSIFRG